MNGFDIVLVIAIILFARLGVSKYIQMKNEPAKASELKDSEK
jgi:hypothetical protein